MFQLKPYFFQRFYLFIFRERGREGERERNISVWLPLAWPLLGIWPATQAWALTGNRTGDSLGLPHQPGQNLIYNFGCVTHFFLCSKLQFILCPGDHIKQ